MGYRKTILASGEIYHIFTRGVAKQPIFTNSLDYGRLFDLLDYYRFVKPALRFSHFYRLPHDRKKEIANTFAKKLSTLVEILTYCFMPNHIHILLKQNQENGISKFTANLFNSYVRYYNTKHKRVGPLFQSSFKAVRIESNEQLIHVNRYIHLNPTTSYVVKTERLEEYPWSSLPFFLGKSKADLISPALIFEQFKDRKSYRKFVYDQIDYQRKLNEIKHLVLEE